MSSLYTRLKITLGKANADAHALAALESDATVSVTVGKDIISCTARQNTADRHHFLSGRPLRFARLRPGIAAVGR